MKQPAEIAGEILDELNDRSGFDGWWGSVDDGIRDEILTTITSLISEGTHTAPQAPIAKIVVAEDDGLMTMLYAPGLPPGEHEVYLDPSAPGLGAAQPGADRG